MDIKHSTGESVITSVKGYLWFLCLNLIFGTWLLLRVFGGGEHLLQTDNYAPILYAMMTLSLVNLLITLKLRDHINEGWYQKGLPAMVLIFGVLWALIFFNLLRDYNQPTMTMVILSIILLPAVITFYISGKLLALFTTPIIISLIYGELLSPVKFTLIQGFGGIIILIVVLSARYILLETWLQTQRSEYEKNLLIKRLVKLAHYDTLTGLFNRRSLADYFKDSVQQLEHTQKSLFVIVLDIDFFKQYNDIYGHVAGDKCLIQVSRAIEQSLRKASDAAFRFGGEEFVVLAICDGMPNAVHIAKRIQQAISDARIRHAGSSVSQRVTVSQGIAKWHPEMPLETLLEFADKELYQAKREGRNRICWDKNS